MNQIGLFLVLTFALLNTPLTAQALACSTTIKCSEGRASCSIEGLEGIEQTSSICGRNTGKHRSCYSAFKNTLGQPRKYETFVCCSKTGDAITVNSNALADSLCSDSGTVE